MWLWPGYISLPNKLRQTYIQFEIDRYDGPHGHALISRQGVSYRSMFIHISGLLWAPVKNSNIFYVQEYEMKIKALNFSHIQDKFVRA